MQSVIVTIEDDADLAEFTQRILGDAGFTVYVADDAPRGLKLIESVNPDLILLDLHLPSISGDSLLVELQNMYPHIPIIIVTVENNPQQIARSFQLGANDYLSKPYSSEELIARIKARINSPNNQNNVLTLGELHMNLNTHEVKRGRRPISLTAQEFKLLEFLMSHPNQVLSRESILSRIWATSPDVETRVVDVYVGYLRKKIQNKIGEEVIRSVRGFGYMMQAPGFKKDERVPVADVSRSQ